MVNTARQSPEYLALSLLQRTIRAMHELWYEATRTMTLEQVTYHERPGVLPIAFSIMHQARMEDEAVQNLLTGKPSIWRSGGWSQKIGVTVDDPGRELTVSQMEQLRIFDYDAFRAYQREIYEVTEAWLDTLDPARLNTVLFEKIPPTLEKAYIAHVVGEGSVTLLDAITCWLLQHGIRHLGELEHARALVGLGGMTS